MHARDIHCQENRRSTRFRCQHR